MSAIAGIVQYSRAFTIKMGALHKSTRWSQDGCPSRTKLAIHRDSVSTPVYCLTFVCMLSTDIQPCMPSQTFLAVYGVVFGTGMSTAPQEIVQLVHVVQLARQQLTLNSMSQLCEGVQTVFQLDKDQLIL